MNLLDWSILWPACLAGLIVTAIHVPLGVQVLERGIVFIDLAIAQIAGVGVVVGHFVGLETGWAVQGCALAAAAAGALLLTWSDRRFPQVQEAIIGVTFVLAACLTLLLLARDPHGGEHLKELLVGQILWVSTGQLVLAGAVYAALLAGIGLRPGWLRQRLVFYLVFALVVTISVQLVGVYLVFASLIVPALATRGMKEKARLRRAYGVSLAGYAAGIATSSMADLPTGPTIVCTMIAFALLNFAATSAARR
jgi:zinc/manganese transport system permease protein